MIKTNEISGIYFERIIKGEERESYYVHFFHNSVNSTAVINILASLSNLVANDTNNGD